MASNPNAALPRRALPALPPPPGLDQYRARLLIQGWDTLQEAFSVKVDPSAWGAIGAARAAAEEADPRREVGASLDIAGEVFQVMPYGAKGGILYRLDSPDMLVFFRASTVEWNVSVRYTAAGLWQWGAPALRKRAYDLMCAIAQDEGDGVLPDPPRLSRADYAFDFDAPDFAEEVARIDRRHWVTARGHAKLMGVGTTEAYETFTLGNIARLQVTLYDKAREIREASGKDWMRDRWQSSSEHVWRIEVRFGGEYLKERGLREYDHLSDNLPAMLSGALKDRRLTLADASRARRSFTHPLWYRAIVAAGDAPATLPVEIYSTARADEFRAQMKRQLAGTARAVVAATTGAWSEASAHALMQDAIQHALDDEQHAAKVAKNVERFRWVRLPA